MRKINTEEKNILRTITRTAALCAFVLFVIVIDTPAGDAQNGQPTYRVPRTVHIISVDMRPAKVIGAGSRGKIYGVPRDGATISA